jgi:hypothetical protein
LFTARQPVPGVDRLIAQFADALAAENTPR